MKILSIDDEETNEKALERAKKSLKFDYEIEYAKTIEEAYKKILNGSYDVIIVDLKLTSIESEAKGNELIEIILKKIKCMLIVYSGNIELLDNNLLEKYKESPFILKTIKGSTTQKTLLEIIKEKEELGFFEVISDVTINEKLNMIFWNGLNELLKNGMDYPKDMLSTYNAILLEHEIISLHEKNNKKLNGELIYIPKRFCNEIGTGTILEIDNEKYVVITAACDLAQNKTKKLHLLRCISKEDYAKDKKNKETYDTKCEEYIKLLKNNPKSIGDSAYVLPKGFFLDDLKILVFHDLKVIERREVSVQNIVCQINPRVTKEIVSKFANCFGRQGSPDFTI